MTKLSIIVPTYNERDNLNILVARIHNAVSAIDYEIVIVDDNSPDGTGELAEELTSSFPIKVVHRAGKLGLASAVLDGFKQAEGDVLGVIDADLQHPPEKVRELYDRIETADIVVASRYIEGGGMEGWTFTREMISRGARKMPHFLFARIRTVSDPLSGFFLFRREVIDGVELNPVGYKILLEILIRGKHNSVAEVPYMFKGRERGESNLTFAEEVNYLKHLCRLVRAEGESKRFIKFCTVGVSGVLVNLGTYWMLSRPAGLRDLIAEPISVEMSILTNFILNDLWTFKDRSQSASTSRSARALKFNMVCATGALINFSIFYLLTRVFDLFDMLALLVAIIVATSFNFILNKWLTWE